MGNPKRGDVIVFHAPASAKCVEGTGCDFIKRILGLPGETIEVRNGSIFINGELLPEEYLPADFKTSPGAYTANGPVTLGVDQYLAVGDNRDHSSDSRTWGPVSKSEIVGKAFFRYWPADSINSISGVNYSF